MAFFPSFLLEERWGGNDHPPPVFGTRMGEIMADFASSFWKWYEGDHDHLHPFLKR